MTEQRKSSDAIPEEFGGLIAEFRGLLEKYPRADRHFSLAYHPAGRGEESGTTMTVGISQPVFECSEIEPGFVVCERVDEQ
ncbi:hypothetical protein M5362_31380 [Streptomyces sp. Je 1-79]|uniref:hypothetical protein n=1 Tax=Streptomyces sp. Je 1-79 TaxID=2943847 RepID=UPI0021A858B1|nr:hypothetical protein [Streptomyces sp. Je 1-79]MCT4357610.1 hypothetical protein [Streptomyces sp. Je 1-79]